MKIDGACHCGHITYEAEIDPEKIVICHCTDCQTLSGTAFRTVTHSREGSFKLLSGQLKEYIKTGGSGAGRPQGFCPECGTPIYGTSVDDGPKAHSLRVGTIRQRDALVPTTQVWTRSRQPWVPEELTADIRKNEA